MTRAIGLYLAADEHEPPSSAGHASVVLPPPRRGAFLKRSRGPNRIYEASQGVVRASPSCPDAALCHALGLSLWAWRF
jgi:hypothetical protein